MSAAAVTVLARLAERTYQSFSEAAGQALDLLEESLPPGVVALGRFDEDERVYRVLDVRGATSEALARGTVLPMPREAPNPDVELLDALAIRSWLAVPLLASNGDALGALWALSTDENAYREEDWALVAVCARLLAAEWEGVQLRADLRRLREQLRDRDRTDHVTGLPNRQSFLEALEREWRLCKRGAVESHMVVLKLPNRSEIEERYGEAMATLMLKDVAEALQAVARKTDHTGRLDDELMGVILVGCKGREGAEAFVSRLCSRIAHVARERPEVPHPVFGFSPLGGIEEPVAVLEAARADLETAAAALAAEREAELAS
ncbi:putative diguanylate cyclase YeaP [bacterium HR41]|nr:putative diguanylate cyclase YeaP [bacterium HR41]